LSGAARIIIPMRRFLFLPHHELPMSRLLALALFALAGLSACTAVVEDTRPGQPVKQRQDAFKALLRTFEPMGTMLRTDHYEPQAFARMAGELVTLRDLPWAHFGPDTDYPPSRSKPAVWARAADFERERVRFFETTDALLAAAATHEPGQVATAYEAVYQSCRACHRDFRK
jgi:cytochrome c556